MKRLTIIICALICSTELWAQTSNTEAQNYVEVTGVSEITLTPDIFYLVITIDEGDSKGRITASEQEQRMIKEFSKAGIDVGEQLKLNSLSSTFEKRNSAYSSANYTLKLTSESSLVEVFDILNELYISNAYLERTESSKMEEARIDARCKAVQSAKSTAEQLAGAVDQSIGECIYILDVSNDYTPTNYVTRTYAYRALSNSAESSAADSTPLEVKEIKVSYKVKTRFRLNP